MKKRKEDITKLTCAPQDVAQMTDEELDSALKVLEEKEGILKKREGIIYKITKWALISFVVSMLAGMVFLFKGAWNHGQLLKTTNYNDLKEQIKIEEIADLEEQLYSKEITPEEFVSKKNSIKELSTQEYFENYATKEEKIAYQKVAEDMDKSVFHLLGNGVAGLGGIFMELPFAVVTAAGIEISKKRLNDIDIEKERRRFSKNMKERADLINKLDSDTREL